MFSVGRQKGELLLSCQNKISLQFPTCSHGSPTSLPQANNTLQWSSRHTSHSHKGSARYFRALQFRQALLHCTALARSWPILMQKTAAAAMRLLLQLPLQNVCRRSLSMAHHISMVAGLSQKCPSDFHFQLACCERWADLQKKAEQNVSVEDIFKIPLSWNDRSCLSTPASLGTTSHCRTYQAAPGSFDCMHNIYPDLWTGKTYPHNQNCRHGLTYTNINDIIKCLPSNICQTPLENLLHGQYA